MITLKHVLALIILIALMAIAGCEQDEDEISRLNSSIEEITGGAFEAPLHEDYPLVYAYLRKPLVEIDNGPYFINLQYSIDDVELVKVYEDEAMVKKVEESQGISILYGPYEGTTPIMIEYSSVFKYAGISGADEIGNWNINGQEVEYAYINRQGREVISAYLNLDEAGINVTYFLSDIFTEEDTKVFTAYLVNELY
jgi:uncharacterized membrane protein